MQADGFIGYVCLYIILRWVVSEQGVRAWTVLEWLRIGVVLWMRHWMFGEYVDWFSACHSLKACLKLGAACKCRDVSEGVLVCHCRPCQVRSAIHLRSCEKQRTRWLLAVASRRHATGSTRTSVAFSRFLLPETSFPVDLLLWIFLSLWTYAVPRFFIDAFEPTFSYEDLPALSARVCCVLCTLLRCLAVSNLFFEIRSHACIM